MKKMGWAGHKLETHAPGMVMPAVELAAHVQARRMAASFHAEQKVLFRPNAHAGSFHSGNVFNVHRLPLSFKL